jgi:phosphopantetheine--protein transferase-like protein
MFPIPRTSRSSQLADRRLGVDIENIRVDLDIAVLAERFFSAREQTSIQALPQNLRLQAFFACWTRKESLLKATGGGSLSCRISPFLLIPTGSERGRDQG